MDVTGDGTFPEIALSASDCLIAVCGYEKRSLNVVERFKNTEVRRIGIDFETIEIPGYPENRTTMDSHGFDFIPARAFDLVQQIRRKISSAGSTLEQVEPIVVVDVSSMSRSVLAQTIEALVAVGAPSAKAIYFVYNSSAYTYPPSTVIDVLKSQPASPFFAGSLDDSSRPIALIMGLSYEPGRALGCMDQFEAVDVFAFRPHGGDSRFQADIDESNRVFIDLIGEERVIPYSVENPMALYNDLRSLVLGLTVSHRVVVVPFGPKIFSTAAMLIALDQPRGVSIWRVTGETFEPPVQREATEIFCFYRIAT
jgi:hypothetical protein